jgi:hypothetical protein
MTGFLVVVIMIELFTIGYFVGKIRAYKTWNR